MKPLFITFEGLDGSGKSTHLKRAEQWMSERGFKVCRTQEPGGTPLGEAIRRTFLDRRWGEMDGRVEAMMVFASRRQHLLEVIDPALADGQHVLCDRFTDSTYAYQGAGRGLERPWIDQLDTLATDRRCPDDTLLFDLTVEQTHDRRQSSKRRQSPDGVNRLDIESQPFYELVRQELLERARQDPERFHLIDSSGDHDATWAQVERVLRDLLGVTR